MYFIIVLFSLINKLLFILLLSKKMLAIDNGISKAKDDNNRVPTVPKVARAPIGEKTPANINLSLLKNFFLSFREILSFLDSFFRG